MVTIIVGASGNGDYTSIAEAIQNAQPQTEILVRPGLYRERIVIDKPLKIIGEGQVENILLLTIPIQAVF